MKKNTLKILLFFHIFLFGMWSQTDAQNIELTVIGNSETVPEQMDMNQLRSVLKGEKMRWDNGTVIKIALMKTNTLIGSQTSEKIYNMSANELNKYFLALVFQGKVKAPLFFTSESELENYVARTPGAIGVSNNSTAGNIKVVEVDGKIQI